MLFGNNILNKICSLDFVNMWCLELQILERQIWADICQIWRRNEQRWDASASFFLLCVQVKSGMKLS